MQDPRATVITKKRREGCAFAFTAEKLQKTKEVWETFKKNPVHSSEIPTLKPCAPQAGLLFLGRIDMEDIDFEKFATDMMADELNDAILKFVGEDPKNALMFMVGRMIGKFEVMRQMSAIAKTARDEMLELKNILDADKKDGENDD